MIYNVDKSLNVIIPPTNVNNGNNGDNENNGNNDPLYADWLLEHECWRFRTKSWAYFGHNAAIDEAAFLAAEQAESDGNPAAAIQLLEYAIRHERRSGQG